MHNGKLYIVVDERLSISQQGVQAAHAVSSWALAHPAEHKYWTEVNNNIVILKAPMSTISEITWKLHEMNQTWAVFREPYWKDRITAVAITPAENIPIISTLPLAMK